MAELFGPGLKAQLLVTANMPEVPDEAKLLQAVVDKVGPNANKEKLLWHLRASRGKVHWAVNSYLRAVLGEGPPVEHPSEHREDFDPPACSHISTLAQQRRMLQTPLQRACMPAQAAAMRLLPAAAAVALATGWQQQQQQLHRSCSSTACLAMCWSRCCPAWTLPPF